MGAFGGPANILAARGLSNEERVRAADTRPRVRLSALQKVQALPVIATSMSSCRARTAHAPLETREDHAFELSWHGRC